jgi:hypothetical protein
LNAVFHASDAYGRESYIAFAFEEGDDYDAGNGGAGQDSLGAGGSCAKKRGIEVVQGL